jgi:uncharacterized protein YktB (UPF0637 family)
MSDEDDEFDELNAQLDVFNARNLPGNYSWSSEEKEENAYAEKELENENIRELLALEALLASHAAVALFDPDVENDDALDNLHYMFASKN